MASQEPALFVTDSTTRKRDLAKEDCRTLKQCFCVGALMVLIYSLVNCRWTATLVTVNSGTCSLHLSRAPIWDPPAAPAYADFANSFPFLQDKPAPPHPATVHLEIASSFVHFALWLWPICCVVAIIYSTLSGHSPDLLLDVVWWTAICMTASAALCVLLWIAFGGWGPPDPAFFALLGIIIGPCIAFLRQGWSGRAAELLAEKRQVPK
ncbi:hypothetical protein Fuma_00817 [Fuerstiella marisgermanici]|uniref:Uncharacterized protein n=1 Tax=Fuerstiella marisgermanici TaxID=1891926 RepID=A0A1P8WB07_9PLAN|nr:hypothetical protein Fuma_00817 [Fuerstiella marisgermanici]